VLLCYWGTRYAQDVQCYCVTGVLGTHRMYSVIVLLGYKVRTGYTVLLCYWGTRYAQDVQFEGT
jgi:3-mercaptopyruvate sulfurtransferase SseA